MAGRKQMPDAIHLIYGSDDNYWFPTAISAASAAYGCSKALVIHLFDAGVSDAHYAAFESLVMKANPHVVCERNVLDSRLFTGFGAWRGSVVTYSRMFIQDILPDLDWAIYVDGDTLWLGDIAKLWGLRNESVLILASIDPPMPLGEQHPDEDWYVKNGIDVPRDGYLCMGLMLANLKGMRAFGMSEKIRAFMAKHPKPCIVDQTVLNCVCRGRLAELPREWGVFSAWHGTVSLTGDACVHYVDDLPWRRNKINRLVSDIILVWFVFTERALGLPLRRKYLTRLGWFVRRYAFLLFKNIQPMVRANEYVHSRLRNTHGLSDEEWAVIRSRFDKFSKRIDGK